MKNAVGMFRGNFRNAFTLIELLAVLGIATLLMLLLVPTLAGTKADTWAAQCRNNLKQLGTGFRLFEQDHNEMFPPAGHVAGGSQLAWDTYIIRYIGGSAAESWLTSGVLPISLSPVIERCPTDTQPKVSWIGNPPWNGIRSYAMVSCGSSFAVNFQVDPSGTTYPLPVIALGVGIYWQGGGVGSQLTADWDAKSYKTSVVKDPAGSILLVEEPNGQGAAGNIWPCASFSVLPLSSNSLYSVFAQIDPNAPPQGNSSSGLNQGAYTYRLHGNRFNYLFHDGRVQTLSPIQTVGTGTLANPKGMWTVASGD